MKNLALLGISYGEYGRKLNKILDSGKEFVWGWTYKHDLEMLRILERKESFKMYIYNTTRSIDKHYAKKIVHFYNVTNFEYNRNYIQPSEAELLDPEMHNQFDNYRGIYYIDGYGTVDSPTKWTDFVDYNTEQNLEYYIPRSPNSYWRYVIEL